MKIVKLIFFFSNCSRRLFFYCIAKLSRQK